MNVTATLAPDGSAQVHCPRPGCSAVLCVKPRGPRTWVTCAADGCGHRFVLDVPELVAAPPPLAPRQRPRQEAGGNGMVAALVAGAAIIVLLVGGALVFGVVWFLRHRAANPPDAGAVVQTPAPVFASPAEPVDRPERRADPPHEETEAGPARPMEEPSEPRPIAAPPKKGPAKGTVARGSDAPSKDAIDKVKRSTALIERKDGGSGSGFVIQSGIVMTNFHVVAGSPLDELTVRFVSLDDTAPPALKPTLLYCHPERDLAILRVDTDRPPLEFCPADTKLEGLEVAVVGNPTDGVRGQVTVNKVTTGHLAAPIRRGAGWTYYELRAEARPGNSGGPVVDRKTGKLVGVMQSIAVGRGPERSYCIPFGEAKLALDRLPADRGKEAAAIKVAVARHALDYFNREVPIIENMARNAMTLQVNLLKAKAQGSGAQVRILDRRTGQFLSGAEVLTQLKEEYAKSYSRLEKLADGPIKSGPEVPSALASRARQRLEACAAMRSLAGSKTQTETAFRKEIDARTAASETAVRAFEEDYKKFLDGLDEGPKGK